VSGTTRNVRFVRELGKVLGTIDLRELEETETGNEV
jgi:hypothetical protein